MEQRFKICLNSMNLMNFFHFNNINSYFIFISFEDNFNHFYPAAITAAVTAAVTAAITAAITAAVTAAVIVVNKDVVKFIMMKDHN